MAAPRLDADDLAAPRHADALLRRLVALDLRHAGLTLLMLARAPGLLPAPWAGRLAAPRRPAARRPVLPRPAAPRRSSFLARAAVPPSRRPGPRPARACGRVRRGSWACGAMPS